MTAVQRPTPNYDATQPITKCAGQERRPQDQKIWSYPPFPKCAQNFRRTIRRTVISSSPNFHTHKTPRRTIRRTDHTSDVPYVILLFWPFSVESAAFPSARSIPRIKNRILHSTVLSYRLSITSKFTSTYHTSAASTHHTSDAPYVENRRTIRRTYLPSRTTSTLDYNPYGHLTTFQLTHNS